MPRTSQPFDLTKLDYETRRKQKRKKLLLWSLPAVIIVFLLAFWFILPRILTHFAISAYKAENYGVARNWLTPLTWTSPEQFVIAFNSGTVDTQLGEYDRAEDELSRAVAIAPNEQKKCMAAQNLVTSLKAHAKSLKSKPKEARVYTTKADTVIKENPKCFKGSAASGGGSSQGSSSSQNESPTKSQQQQLEQKEEKGRDRKARFARDEKFDPNDPSIKPW